MPTVREQLMPAGVNSPVRAMRSISKSIKPLVIDKGEAAYLYSHDNEKLVDYICGWGSIICGHAQPIVIEAVAKAAKDGLGFGMSTQLEERYAQYIVDQVKVDMIRVVNSGTEATMSAIRLARACTNRDVIIKFAGAYHGHSDALLAEAGSGALTFGTPTSAGVVVKATADTVILPYNDKSALDAFFSEHGNKVAAVIIEPIAGNMNLVIPSLEFMTALKDHCAKSSAMLISDEVMTGFRATPTIAIRDLFNVEPDIVCLGKVIGGGMPAAVFGASKDTMEQLAPLGPVYQAGTLSGNPLALTAGLASMELFDNDAFVKTSSHLKVLCESLEEIAKKHNVAFKTQSIGAMAGWYFSDQIPNTLDDVQNCNESNFQKFFLAMLKNNVLLPPSMYEASFITMAHDEVSLELTKQAAEAAFSELAN